MQKLCVTLWLKRLMNERKYKMQILERFKTRLNKHRIGRFAISKQSHCIEIKTDDVAAGNNLHERIKRVKPDRPTVFRVARETRASGSDALSVLIRIPRRDVSSAHFLVREFKSRIAEIFGE